ncbi:MAG: replication initiator protein A [Paenibacillaceae bacterium]
MTIENVSKFKAFVQFPIELIEVSLYRELTSNDRIIYSLLNRRMQLSSQNLDKYLDVEGRIFVYYSIQEMASYINLSVSTVSKSYNTLEEHELIHREKVEHSFKKTYKTYVLHPVDECVVNKLCELNMESESPVLINDYMSEQIKSNASNQVELFSSNKEHINKQIDINNKVQEISAKAVYKQGTLFNIPKKQEIALLSKIDQANLDGKWETVTTTDFVEYFIAEHNKLFPTKISRVKSKEGNQLVGVFKRNFIFKYSLRPEDTCAWIDKILVSYKKSESSGKYSDCFDLATFYQGWKIEQLVQYFKHLENYDGKHVVGQDSMVY